MMRVTACLLLAAAVNAVDVDAVSMDGEAASVQGQSAAAAAPPPRMNPRHNNPKDWAAQADASAKALNALEAKDQKVVPSAATGDSGATAAKPSEPAGDAAASENEKEPLVESGDDAAAAFHRPRDRGSCHLRPPARQLWRARPARGVDRRG